MEHLVVEWVLELPDIEFFLGTAKVRLLVKV